MKYLIAGLGNVGEEYNNTRHNIGFEVVNLLAEEQEQTFELDRYGFMARFKFKGRQVILLKPTTYMNLSGKAIKFWLDKEKISIENLLVVTDDLNLPFGKLRLKGKGSAGGHNGLTNIEQLLSTNRYARMRFGIGDNFGKGRQVNFVLSPFSNDEQRDLPTLIKKCATGVNEYVSIGLTRTMNNFNTQ